jgi:hypothetical protein
VPDRLSSNTSFARRNRASPITVPPHEVAIQSFGDGMWRSPVNSQMKLPNQGYARDSQ